MDLLLEFVSRSVHSQCYDNDIFDRLNFQVTPFLFVLLSLVNISRLYIGSAINCFAKAEFRGGWVQYAQDYCLVESTYYLRADESIPIEHEMRGQKRVAYYQGKLKDQGERELIALKELIGLVKLIGFKRANG